MTTKQEDIDDEAFKEAFRLYGKLFDVWDERNEEVTNNPNLAIVKGDYFLCMCENCNLVFSSEYALGGESLGKLEIITIFVALDVILKN